MSDQRITHPDAPLVHKLNHSIQRWAYFPNVQGYYPNGVRVTGLGMNNPRDMTDAYSHQLDFPDYGPAGRYGSVRSEVMAKKIAALPYKKRTERLQGGPGWLSEKF